MPSSEGFELVEAVKDDVSQLIEGHKERRKDWYFHDLIPWERGESFKDKPWDESQVNISPEASTSLVLNLLTEDNLPYYHAAIEKNLPDDSVFREWNGLWTAEEGQHAIAIRSYLLTSRNCDPYDLEEDRMATMRAGYHPQFETPADLFAYTAAQELATRVSHRNAGAITDDPAAREIMKAIAADENHHFMFYRGVMTAMLREAPSLAIPAIYRTLANFEMPGVGIPGFLRRSINIAKAGVYNLRIHHDRVVQPLMRDWKIADIKGLTAHAAEVQEKLMALPAQIAEKADRFEARFGLVAT